MSMNVVTILKSRRWLAAIVVVIVLVAVGAGVVALQSASKADRDKDAQVKSGLVTIRHAVFAWANAHEKNVPPAGKLTSGYLSTYLPANASWPVNPFTGELMRVGAGPGEVRYKVLSSHVFTVDSVGVDGKSVW